MIRRMLGLTLALTLLLLAGCGSNKPQPTLQVTSEQKGKGLVLRLQTTNFVIGKDGHAHLHLNDGPEVMIYANTYTIPELKPGLYKIEVELSNSQHENTGIKQIIEQEIK